MTKVLSTKNYEMFKFREDNRDRIIHSHVLRLQESIKARNLLEYQPICVNGDMEVLDGQHRLLAAKGLGIEIYYKQNKELHAGDIIIMNMAQPWGQMDYLNYYVKNDYPEYKKLAEFLKSKRVTIKVALSITMGHTKDLHTNFKQGKYKFNSEWGESIDICWETIDFIKRMNGYSHYTTSARFWSALVTLIQHTHFDENKWRENLKKMVERFTAKATRNDYLRMLMDVHNWRNSNRIDLVINEK